MRVLVADSDHEAAQEMAGLLLGMSHDPLIARDGMEAWRIFTDSDVQVVISQWRLPRVSGLELCKKIRRVEREAYTNVVILVEKSELPQVKKVFASGADDCWVKPVNPIVLKARINSCTRAAKAFQKIKELQDTLSASRNRLRVVFDALPEEIVAVDRQGKIVSLNQTYVSNRDSDFSELWRQEIQAESIYFLERFHQSLFKTSLKSVMETGKPVTINDMHVQQGGEQRKKDIQFLPVTNDRNQIQQVVIVARDTTEEPE